MLIKLLSKIFGKSLHLLNAGNSFSVEYDSDEGGKYEIHSPDKELRVCAHEFEVYTDACLRLGGAEGVQIGLNAPYNAPLQISTRLVFGNADVAIASGQVSMSGKTSYLTVSAESGTADDLVNLTGFSTGTLVILRAAVGHTITVKHGTGVFQLAGGKDCVLSNTEDKLVLLVGIENAVWVVRELCRTNAPVIPSGLISLWSGTIATIPSGWALCNGDNGTPDLRNSFIVGADADDGGVAKTTVTGPATKSGGYRTHFHTLSISMYGSLASGGTSIQGYDVLNQGDGYYNVVEASGGGNTNSPVENPASSALPPYYALAYIMKL